MIRITPRLAPALALTTVAAAVLAGCTTTADGGDGDVTIAAVFPNTSDPFFQTVACGAQARADELGVDLQQFNSTGSEANTIASNFQTASLVGADGMIVTPFNNNQFVAQYTELMADGVPVVTGNGTDPQVDYLAIASDTDTSPFAEEIAALLPEGAGTMVYMGGAPGIPPLETRTLPFVDAVQEMRPDLVALETEYSGFDINTATSDAASMIIANPDLKLIIAASGPDGVGAAAAIQQADKVGEITLIAFDAVPSEVEALRAGTITALIAQDPFSIGAAQVDAVVDYLAENPDGGAVEPAGSLAIPGVLLTADNIDDPEYADYIYKTEC